MSRRLATALLLVAALVSGTASAQPTLGFAADLDAAGWRVLPFPGREPTRFRALDPATVAVEAVGSSSMLTRSLEVDTARYRCLTWRWMVEESTLPATDLSRRGGDDRHLIVSLGFKPSPEDEGIAARLRRALARGQSGRDVPGSVLIYVWGGAHPRDAWIESPYMQGAGQLRVLEPSPGPRGRWLQVRVDVAADYEARFGRPAPPVMELALGGDSDDTGTRSLGRIADLAFKERC